MTFSPPLASSPEALVAFLQTWPPECVSLVMLIACCLLMLLFLRFFGVMGLAAYVVLAITCSNIQVLTGTQFLGMTTPVALGTVTFASTYLAVDIVTEYYGAAWSRKIVVLGLLSMVAMSVMMLLGLGHRLPMAASDPATQAFHNHHQAALQLFSPSPRLFLASMAAYALSEWADIRIFAWVSHLTRGKKLWLRTQLAGFLSCVLDTLTFSVLAWVVLAPQPVSIKTLFYTYIVGSIVLRVPIILLGTPCVYWARYVCPSLSTASLDKGSFRATL